MKILFAHVAHSPGVEQWYKNIVSVAGDELEVHRFCVTLDSPGPRLSWSELDKRWQQKEKKLMDMYARLRDAASACDIFFLYNGANIHPEFIQYLSTFNVYCCFDDPESSPNLSAPVAVAFDAVFYGNIASRFQYEHWGCKKLAWLPIFTAPEDVPSKNVGERLLVAERKVEISLIAEKSSFRIKRLNRLVESFPQAKCYGSGWASGRIDESSMFKLYCQSQMGWNIHNSTGPINRRTFTLPAFGVLQLCDNKTGLGQIFRLGEEVIGFDTIQEAIDLTRYYLENYDKQREIAANGFRRYWKDYHPAAIWERIGMQLEKWTTDISRPEIVPNFPKKNALDVFKPHYWKILSTASFVKCKTIRFIEQHRERKTTKNNLQHESVYLEEVVLPYIENPEMRGVNMSQERIAKGDPFEWPNMLALNWAVTSLIRNSKKIIEIGSGTGPFAKYASMDPTHEIYCFEEDDFARSWAQKNRNYTNVIYQKSIPKNFSECFDLLISIDVFEHVGNMKNFLDLCSSLAPKAIFSTPNREIVRGMNNMGPPSYPPHVREFSPGELYWILKQYYKNVSLYHMPDVFVPWLEPMTTLTKGTPIIAKCSEPLA